MSAETAQTFPRAELPDADFIFGSTAGMREVRKGIERALHDDLPVLIEGESGTGKELVGRFLHGYSARSAGPFLKVNCTAMPAGLVEGEIFGYERGLATDGRSGFIARAAGGTLFLDEVCDLDLKLQRKLAYTFESGSYRRIDGGEDLLVNSRFVCATSLELEIGSAHKTVLADMLKCFVHHRIRLLPLRERKQDIPQLCEYLLEKFARNFSRPVPRLSSHVLRVFQQWNWPGNIRELENWIARIVIFGTEEAMGPDFSRERQAWQELLPKPHRVAHLKMSRRTKRSRKHL